jgi:BolA family transcriptional regulator, general stress-responsive regulator
MMDAKQRYLCIEQRLQQALTPESLIIQDESEQHRGHPAHQDGASHFAIIIRAKSLAGLSKIDAHRRIYALLNDLIPHEIHALKIKINE